MAHLPTRGAPKPTSDDEASQQLASCHEVVQQPTSTGKPSQGTTSADKTGRRPTTPNTTYSYNPNTPANGDRTLGLALSLSSVTLAPCRTLVPQPTGAVALPLPIRCGRATGQHRRPPTLRAPNRTSPSGTPAQLSDTRHPQPRVCQPIAGPHSPRPRCGRALLRASNRTSPSGAPGARPPRSNLVRRARAPYLQSRSRQPFSRTANQAADGRLLCLITTPPPCRRSVASPLSLSLNH